MTQLEPRARRARLFCDAYGLTGRTGLADQIVRRQLAVHDAIKRQAEAGDAAYVRLWELGAGTGIQRQAEFVRAHRRELEDALA
ncbi:MAG: hypothetical protein ACLQDY_18945 [Streptosporangiaceae bacterium]